MKQILLTLCTAIIITLSLNAQTATDSISPSYALGADTIQPTSTPIFDHDSLAAYSASLDSLAHNLFINRNYIPCDDLPDTVMSCDDSIYIQRLQSLPYIMEMTYNPIVRNYIEMYARRPRQIATMLALGQHYFPLFEQKLEQYGLPLELRYLPIIESALNPQATSPVGAAGLWQFMIATGKIYKLEINSLVDERRDPAKATDAAARYLADLYKIYGDWHLVIAAYNCGPGNVAKAIRRSGGKRRYWEIYDYLPRETRGYVPIFIAANYIMNYHKEHNICPDQIAHDYITDTVMITDRVHLEQIAHGTGIPLDQIQFLNPQYRNKIIPGNIKPYPLSLPLDQINQYSINRDSILAYKPELVARELKATPLDYDYSGSGVKYYKVKSGDTLGGIAARYRVTVSQLKRWNNIKGTMIRIGQRLKIYK